MMRVRFNPPPGWPLPDGFIPPQGWQPDPHWPPAPPAWQFWVPQTHAAEPPAPAPSHGPQPDPTSFATGVPGDAGASPSPGRRMLTMVLAVATVGVLGLGLVLGLMRLLAPSATDGGDDDPTSAGTDTSQDPVPTWTATNDATELVSGEVGACVAREVLEVDILNSMPMFDCEHPHAGQIVGLFDLEGGPDADWRGASANIEVDRGCRSAFEDFIGAPIDDSGLLLWTVGPTERTWTEWQDREVICIAYLEDGDASGSWEGTGGV